MATQKLKFHKVTALPASCALGDVYYVVGKGIYVCTKEASSGATEAANYQRFSFANAASTSVVGVTKLSDSTTDTSSTVAATSKAVSTVLGTSSDDATKATVYGAIAKAAAAQSTANGKWSQKTATQASGGTAVEGTVKGLYADTSLTGYAKSPIISGEVWYRDTHNSHGHTFKANTANTTADTATSVDVVSALNNASATTGNLSSTYNRVSVPTLKVTNDLAGRISANESAITNLQTVTATGMQYKGTISSISTTDAYVAGSVYRVSTKISIQVAQSATGAAITAEVGDFMVCSTAGTGTAAKWDVWQANVNKDAYWDNNNPVSGNFVIADGTTGKIKDSGKSASSFDAAGTASDLVTTLRGGYNDTLKSVADAAATVQTNLTNHIGNTSNPHKVTKAQVGLGSVTDNRQVVGLASGTTADHFVTWGANGYTVADSGYTADSFDAKGTASGLINTLRGGYNDTLKSVADAAATAQSTADGKWTKVVASTEAQGIMQVGTGLSVSSGTVSVKYGTAANTACQGNDSRLSDARTPLAHNQASNTITAMTGYSKPSSASAIAVDDSLNAAIGKLEYKADDAISKANGKWTKAYAQALAAGDGSKAGVATFNSGNFAVSSVGHVDLIWATFA